jgi:hypothetical protein
LEYPISSLESLDIGKIYSCAIFFIFRFHVVIYHDIDSLILECFILLFHRDFRCFCRHGCSFEEGDDVTRLLREEECPLTRTGIVGLEKFDMLIEDDSSIGRIVEESDDISFQEIQI